MIWTISNTDKYPSGDYVILVNGRDVHSRIPDFDSRKDYEKWYKLTKDYWQYLVYLDNKRTCLRAYKQAKQYKNILRSSTSAKTIDACRVQYNTSMKILKTLYRSANIV